METVQADDVRVERDFTSSDPTYDSTVSLVVARECLDAWRKHRPWTKLRVLREASECPPKASCEGSQGHFGRSGESVCSKQVEAVQYITSCGSPQFYCEEHALLQSEWDVILYDSKPIDRPPPTPEEEAWMVKFRTKDKKKHLGDLMGTTNDDDGKGWVEM